MPATPDLITHIAGHIHEDWRRARRRDDGSFEPRLKETTDTEWSLRNGGSTEVDIANTGFADLPYDWQRENIIAAELAARITDATVDYLAAIIHEQWVSRHWEEQWAAEAGLLVPFADLAPIEQAKDREIARVALRYALAQTAAE